MTNSTRDRDYGIGAQVFVEDATADDLSPWPAEPSGVITGSGGAALQRVTDSGGPTRLWIVQFDEPQTHRDGTTGHVSAHVHEKYLQLAPPFEG